MYITSAHDKIYEIVFADHVYNKPNNILWGYVNFTDVAVSDFMTVYNAALMNELVNASDVYHRFHRYIPELASCQQVSVLDSLEAELIEDCIVQTSSSSADAEYDISSDDTHVAVLSDLIADILPYRRHLMGVFACTSNLFEIFQKNMIMEMSVYHCATFSTASVARGFVESVGERYMGLSPYSIRFMTDKYRNNSALFICQRGHGKTSIVTYIVASAMIHLTPMFVLFVTDNMNLIRKTVSEVHELILRITPRADSARMSIGRPKNALKISFDDDDDDDDDAKPTRPRSMSWFQGTTAHRPNAGKGHDPNFTVLDEAFFYSEQRYPSLLALGQRPKNKLIMTTSPCVKYQRRVARYSKAAANVYMIEYWCTNPAHQKFVGSQSACTNLHGYCPNHVSYTAENKNLTDLMTGTTEAFNDELGILTADYWTEDEGGNGSKYHPLMTSDFFDYINDARCLTAEVCSRYVIYFDPAYDYCGASANALTAVGVSDGDGDLRRRTPVITYIDELFFDETTFLDACRLQSSMIINCIDKLVELSPKASFYVAVENNSSKVGAGAIYREIDLRYGRTVPVYLLYGLNNTPGYTMTSTKLWTIHTAAKRLNSCEFALHVTLDHTMRQRFISQCRNFKIKLVNGKREVSGKVQKGTDARLKSDDVALTGMMGTFFGTQTNTKKRQWVRTGDETVRRATKRAVGIMEEPVAKFQNII